MKKRIGTNKPDVKKDRKVLKLRRNPPTFRMIALVIGEDVKSTHRRYKRALATQRKVMHR